MRRKMVWMLLAALAASVLALGGYIAMERERTDRNPPQITIEAGELSLSVQEDQSELFRGVTAWDDVDGDVTHAVVIESLYGVKDGNRMTVTYAVADQSGNVAKRERVVHFADYQSPRITLKAPLVYEYGGNWDVMEAIGAEDVFDGDIHRLVKATMLTSGTSVTEEGIHDVQFRVTNSVGDSVQLVLPVEVYPLDSYNAELTLTNYMVYLPLGAEINVEDYLRRFETRMEALDLTQGIPENLRIRISGTVDSGTPGVYPISYTAILSDGESSYTGYTKLLVIVEGQEAV